MHKATYRRKMKQTEEVRQKQVIADTINMNLYLNWD